MFELFDKLKDKKTGGGLESVSITTSGRIIISRKVCRKLQIWQYLYAELLFDPENSTAAIRLLKVKTLNSYKIVNYTITGIRFCNHRNIEYPQAKIAVSISEEDNGTLIKFQPKIRKEQQ